MHVLQQDIIESIMAKQPVISNMVTEQQVRIMLEGLFDVLEKDIPGDIVELGCNKGTNALFLQQLLLAYDSKKELHLYDSFEGLPEKRVHDFPTIPTDQDSRFQAGKMQTTEQQLHQNFSDANVPLPHIHKGWFGTIAEDAYPQSVSFAFFDGDFYSSIIDSFERIYPKLSKGAYIFVHDYGWNTLPGVEKACDDFLYGKPEHGTIVKREGLGCVRKL